jgi:hypothetical protein
MSEPFKVVRRVQEPPTILTPTGTTGKAALTHHCGASYQVKTDSLTRFSYH